MSRPPLQPLFEDQKGLPESWRGLVFVEVSPRMGTRHGIQESSGVCETKGHLYHGLEVHIPQNMYVET